MVRHRASGGFVRNFTCEKIAMMEPKHKNARWAPEEDLILLPHLASGVLDSLGTSLLGDLPGRSSQAIISRIRLLRSGRGVGAGKWTDADRAMILANVQPGRLTDWRRIAELMPRRTPTELQAYYYTTLREREENKKPRIRTDMSARLACLGCGSSFLSWDRRKNRLCPRCGGRSDRETGHALQIQAEREV